MKLPPLPNTSNNGSTNSNEREIFQLNEISQTRTADSIKAVSNDVIKNDETSFIRRNFPQDKLGRSHMDGQSNSVSQLEINSNTELFKSSDGFSFADTSSLDNSDDEKDGMDDIETGDNTHNDVSDRENKLVSKEILDSNKGLTKFQTSADDSPIALCDFKINAPPPPEDIDESSDDFGFSDHADFSLSGMDADGIIRPATASPDYFEAVDSDISVFEETPTETKIKKNSTEEQTINSVVTSRPPSGTLSKSISFSKSGIPRLIRSRSDSLASDPDSPKLRKGKNMESSSVKSSGSLSEQFIDRKMFQNFTERKVKQIIAKLDDSSKMQNIKEEFAVSGSFFSLTFIFNKLVNY